MPRVQWSLLHHRPSIEISLTLALGGQQVVRRLLADTGAGSTVSRFELLPDEQDCLLCGGIPVQAVVLGRAYRGSYPVYLLDVAIPLLGFNQAVPAVGLPAPPGGFDGIACFKFLNRFTYGNFADHAKFGLDL